MVVYYDSMVTSIREETADKVAAAIGRSNLTRSEIAEKAFIPRTTLNRKIAGAGEFTLTEISSIALALGIDPAELLPRNFSLEKVSA